MNGLSLRATTRYQVGYVVEATLWVLGISAAVFIAGNLIFTGGIHLFVGDDYFADGTFGFNVGAIMVFMFFIFGVGGIREDLRFFIQNGVGRLTTFMSTIVGGIISAVGVGLASQLLTLALTLLPNFVMANIFNTEGGFFVGWLLTTGALFAAWQVGAFISLIYYRLSRNGAIIFTATIIILFVMITRGIFRNAIDLEGVILTIIAPVIEPAQSAVGYGAAIVIIAIAATIGNFLIIRRVQITE